MKTIDFIHELEWDQIPDFVQHQIKRCLLDTIGSAIGGRRMELSEIIYDFVCQVYGGKGARLWLDGREVSTAGAALAHGMTIDALDIHDNFNAAKGHAGVAVVPTALATLNLTGDTIFGHELLATLAVGYEIALRAGMALHATACDYHTSGAWNTLGCAAIVARRLGLDKEATRHALGIAEYHGPRSQMMRCIDYPTMLKDGSGWGAMVGVSAGLLAARGFTGAPAVTVESSDVSDFWADIGERWYLIDQDFKRHAVCHWAQPPIAGAVGLVHEYSISPQDIARIQIFTFHEATRLTCRRPKSTEEAQYSLPFPVAAAIIHDQLGPDELSGAGLADQQVLNLVDLIEMQEDDECNALFPKVQVARVRIEKTGGEVFESEVVSSPWDVPYTPESMTPSDRELGDKFQWLASGSISKSRAEQLESKIWRCEELEDSNTLNDLLYAP